MTKRDKEENGDGEVERQKERHRNREIKEDRVCKRLKLRESRSCHLLHKFMRIAEKGPIHKYLYNLSNDSSNIYCLPEYC